MAITVVNMIPKSLSGETNQDSEPNLAVNPDNPLQLVGTAFTPNPSGTVLAPIYVSSDGGNTWTLNPIIPGATVTFPTADITMKFGGTSSVLYRGHSSRRYFGAEHSAHRQLHERHAYVRTGEPGE